jgi:hypothetical protein
MAIRIFWGDYEHNNTWDFLLQIKQLFCQRTDIPNTEKLEAFKIHLKSCSEVDQ